MADSRSRLGSTHNERGSVQRATVARFPRSALNNPSPYDSPMSSDDWISLIPLEKCPPGRGVFIEAGGRELAVFRLTDPDRVVVTQNSCPHAGGNLAAGDVEGATVTCPWHFWKFDIEVGRCTMSESIQLRKYASRVSDGIVYARIG